MTPSDNFPIPFGKHKGTKLIDLPASYLLWLLDNDKAGSIKDYILLNEEALRLKKLDEDIIIQNKVNSNHYLNS